MKHCYIALLAICLLMAAPLQPLVAQCTDQLMHTSGSAVVAGVNVTVTSVGNTCAWNTYCPGVTQPYFIGYAPGPGSGPGSFTFTFSPAINGIRLNFSGASSSAPSIEEVRLHINGAHYAMTAPGVANGCDPMALLTVAGDLTGCTGCGVSGWANTNISGFPISTLTVEDFVVGGTPNGSLFSLWICAAILPTEWMSFDATVNAATRGVDLHWTTATEINNDFFTVERSAGGDQWDEIGNLDAVGNSEQATDYRLTDASPLAGLSRYRIRQTSLDGNSSYSEVREVTLAQGAQVSVYPNPVHDQLTVTLAGIDHGGDAGLEITLRNALGQKLQAPQTSTASGFTLNTSALATGVYILEVRTAQGTFVERFTVE